MPKSGTNTMDKLGTATWLVSSGRPEPPSPWSPKIRA